MADEPQVATPPAAEPQFKIIASGTHATQAAGGITTDPQTPAPGPAEPATPATEPGSTELPPASPTDKGTGEPPKAHSVKLGSSKPQGTTNEPPPATPPAASAPPQPQSWEENLKAQGFDEQFINLAKVYKQEGNISRYAEAMSTDFTKMPDEQIHRLNLQREYPEATPDQLDILFESEVKAKYKLDPETFDPESTEAKAARLKMQMDAKKLRSKFTTENEGYKLPSRDVAAEHQQQQQAEADKKQQIRNALFDAQYSKSVLNDKKVVLTNLSIKDDNGKVTSAIPDFTMELADPNEIQDFLTDPQAYKKHMTDAQGNLDPEAHWQVATFATNRSGYNQALINYGKMLGKEELLEEKHNPPARTGTPASAANESLNDAFGSRGKHGKNGG